MARRTGAQEPHRAVASHHRLGVNSFFINKTTASEEAVLSPKKRQAAGMQKAARRLCRLGSVHSDVSAVFDDHALRALGNRARGIPGHAFTGQAVKGDGGEGGDHQLA